MKTKKINKDKVNLITLGCSKNLVDSEVILGQLASNDIAVAHEMEEDDSNIVIINTCSFINLAKTESINTILQYAEYRKNDEIEKLYVTGCLPNRYKEKLIEEIPEVDAFFTTTELPALLEKFNVDYKHELIGERFITTPQHYAYLKISEGCNRTCSFCAIPNIRGRHISKPIEELVAEAESLAKKGVKELMIIAQELTFYGLDIYKKRMLPELMEALNKVEGIEWIKLHYAYPAQFPIEMIHKMKDLDKICNYLDFPLQHASNSMLKAMNRKITREKTTELIKEIRSIIPDICLRTTMLVGFPGETDEDIEELIEFIEEIKFDRLGIFTYSHEDETPGFKLEDNIPQEEKERRAQEVMSAQQEISFEKNQEKVGQTLKVIFDKKEGDWFIGRTEFDSPEVDNEVLVSAKDFYVSVGDFAMVKITEATDFDLYGEIVSE